MSPFELHLGDSRQVLRTLAEASVDSIVCDPPYGLEFMGKEWDAIGDVGKQSHGGFTDGSGFKGMVLPQSYNASANLKCGRCAKWKWDHAGRKCECGALAEWPNVKAVQGLNMQKWHEEWAREALRVLRPGGYLLAFSGTRTYHRMASAIEDAGFEIRDQIGWLYGSGFPKSHNGEWGGTALKPAWEPICMARKPLVGTVEANWLAYGTGALNIDACRVGWPGGVAPEIGTPEWGGPAKKSTAVPGQDGETVERMPPSPLGRWPANIIHDGSDEVVRLFPSEAGAQAPVTVRNADKFRGTYGAFAGNIDEQGSTFHGDSGSAARFFYCAKASKEDRNEGCSAIDPKQYSHDGRETPIENAYQRNSSNSHPTVKPTDLMRYLCRLVTPKGGTVLDPFMGSGSTGKAAVLEGFNFIGIDLTPEYVEIARARIEFARRQGYQPDLLEAA